MMRIKIITLLLVLIGITATSSAKKAALKPRLVVCTDIAPADVEPDDMESMVHLMAYADMFEIEALITSVGWNCDPYPMEWMQYLRRVIKAYASDVPNLMNWPFCWPQQRHWSIRPCSRVLGFLSLKHFMLRFLSSHLILHRCRRSPAMLPCW